MVRHKRSIVFPERANELSKGDVYVITCGIAGCPCGQSETCERGFFSLFIQAVYGIDFAQRNTIPYHIDFGNITYCYSDPLQEDPNWWNYYFEQPIPEKPEHSMAVINRFHELYPIPIWDRSHLRRMHHHVQHLIFQKDAGDYITRAREMIRPDSLGVHVRRTDHPESIFPVRLEDYYKVIDKQIDRFDMLFLSTDDDRVVEEFRKRYGSFVHVNDVMRSSDTGAVHRNFEYTRRRQLGLEVLADCLCLASCKKLILTFSNVSYAALLFNPEIPYTLLERPRTTWRRYKTLIVYYLDKWGIRKW